MEEETRRVTVYLPVGLYERLAQLARAQRRSVSAQTEVMLSDWFEQFDSARDMLRDLELPVGLGGG